MSPGQRNSFAKIWRTEASEPYCGITARPDFITYRYAIEEGAPYSHLTNYYDASVDAAPTVVTLTKDMAASEFGDAAGKKGFTTAGTNAEWLAIADCYFEALNEK